jgi:copper chaperone
MEIQVPSIVCSSCANAVTNAIKKIAPDAQISVNLETKIVSLETQATKETIQGAIEAIGHKVA